MASCSRLEDGEEGNLKQRREVVSGATARRGEECLLGTPHARGRLLKGKIDSGLACIKRNVQDAGLEGYLYLKVYSVLILPKEGDPAQHSYTMEGAQDGQ